MKKEFLIAGLIGATLLGANPAVLSAQERERPAQRWSAPANRPAPAQRSEPRANPGVAQRMERAERPRMAQPRDQSTPRFGAGRTERIRERAATGENRAFPRQNESQTRIQNRGERPGWTQNRPNDNRPAAGVNRPDRPDRATRPDRVNRPDRPDRPQGWVQNRPDNRNDNRNDWRNDDRRDRDRDRNRADWREDRRDRDRADWRNNNRPGSGWDARDRNRASARYNWDRDWRRDQRYDWQRYRDRNRDRYRYRYTAPRGWSYGYSRFSIGISIWSGLYSSSYWINDPYYYRLPPVHGSLRWVRYYDDALLVDIRTGYVVDVIYDFFW